ncbi:MAG: hypothetical protein P8182_12060 [Deltaproteobacteria bacterium]
MNKAVMLAIVMCFLFSASEIMADGASTRMRRAIDRAWKAQMAKEKGPGNEAARLKKEIEDMERKLFDAEHWSARKP